jgi:hypothetical protein
MALVFCFCTQPSVDGLRSSEMITSPGREQSRKLEHGDNLLGDVNL